jgi:PAS domain-containing protein
MRRRRDKTHHGDAEGTSNAIEERMRLIIDTIPTMTWSLRPDGAVDFVNKRWLEHTGIPFEEELKDPTRPVHPQDLPPAIEKWLADMGRCSATQTTTYLPLVDLRY